MNVKDRLELFIFVLLAISFIILLVILVIVNPDWGKTDTKADYCKESLGKSCTTSEINCLSDCEELGMSYFRVNYGIGISHCTCEKNNGVEIIW